MYEVSEAFHRQYADMYDKFVRIHFKGRILQQERSHQVGHCQER